VKRLLSILFWPWLLVRVSLAFGLLALAALLWPGIAEAVTRAYVQHDVDQRNRAIDELLRAKPGDSRPSTQQGDKGLTG
jgi:hypothetical protein